MNRDSVKKLRLDRRLIDRRGWLSAKERNEAIEGLPDVADKAITLGAASDTPEPDASESAAQE